MHTYSHTLVIILCNNANFLSISRCYLEKSKSCTFALSSVKYPEDTGGYSCTTETHFKTLSKTTNVSILGKYIAIIKRTNSIGYCERDYEELCCILSFCTSK